MSAEDLIRAKHLLDAARASLAETLGRWRTQFALFNREELELVTARALDRLTSSPDDTGERLRVWALSEWLKQTPSTHKPSAFKRFWLLSDPHAVEARFIEQTLSLPTHMNEEEYREVARAA